MDTMLGMILFFAVLHAPCALAYERIHRAFRR